MSSAAPATANAPGPPTQKKRLPLLLKLGIALGIFVALAGIGATVAAMLPIRLEPLRKHYPAFSERYGLARDAERCGLSQISVAGRCAAAKPTAVDEVEVTFPSRLKDKYVPELHGTLSIPQGLPGKRPGVVLIHGSGPTNRDGDAPGDLIRPHRPKQFAVLKTLASWLARQGFVVLRYDKRACTKCYPAIDWKQVDFSVFRFEDLRDDARDALEFVAGRAEVDPRALVVIGHSQGGQNAPLVAHGHAAVKAVVMLAGTTQTFEQGLIGQLKRVEQIRLSQLDPIGALQVALMRRQYQSCFDKLRGQYDPQDGCLGGGVTLAALAEETKTVQHTLERIRTLHCPVLAIHGNLDRNIDPEVPRLIAQALEGRDGEVHVIDGLGHLLTNLVEPPAEPDFDPAVYEALRAFFATIPRAD